MFVVPLFSWIAVALIPGVPSNHPFRSLHRNADDKPIATMNAIPKETAVNTTLRFICSFPTFEKR